MQIWETKGSSSTDLSNHHAQLPTCRFCASRTHHAKNSDKSKILVPRRKTLVPRHKNCVPLNLKLQLLPGHFGLVDQQINRGVTFLIEIIDPDYHEALGHLWGLVVSLCRGKMGNGPFQKLAR